MKLRPLILITLIVVLPLAALTWAASRIAENEQLVVQKRYQELMEERLRDINANVTVVFDDIERRFSQLAAIDDFDPAKLRDINRSEPHLLQLFVLSPQGRLTYPDPAGELNAGERSFLIQATQMFMGQDLENAVANAEQSQDAGNSPVTNRVPVMQQEFVQEAYESQIANVFVEFEATSGWFVWYWDRGLNLVYWQRRPSGHIVGCALERARWIADLIAQLPETVDSQSLSQEDLRRSTPTRVRLLNSSAASVYQWGAYEPPDDDRPLCEIPLTTPLASWRLQCFVPLEQLTAGTGRSASLGLAAGLGAVAATLLVIAFLFVREYSRDMREASQQVSFVNQVSHELKTPLTNIRMYAELLERDLNHVDPAAAEKLRERLNVILSEGQRLSRLIGNVLTFARQKRKTLQPQRHAEIPAQLIQQIVNRFRPALADRKIDVQLQSAASEPLLLDADFLEQILGNLISNVEKYAAGGGLLDIQSHVADGVLTIDVRDAGDGIAQCDQDRVFQPFARVSSDVSHAAGTGIGLPIARELAQLHGGDVVLMDGSQGCWFRATLKGAC